MLRKLVLTLALVALAGCSEFMPAERPSFYRDLAEPGAQLDAAAAASMISGYRTNHGLPAVTLDPKLTYLAEAQAEIMARRDKLDHNAGKPFLVRLEVLRLRRQSRGGEYRRRLPHIGGSLFRLARFRPAPRQYAARRRDPHGHRRSLHRGLEIQSLLGADPGGAGGQEGLIAVVPAKAGTQTGLPLARE